MKNSDEGGRIEISWFHEWQLSPRCTPNQFHFGANNWILGTFCISWLYQFISSWTVRSDCWSSVSKIFFSFRCALLLACWFLLWLSHSRANLTLDRGSRVFNKMQRLTFWVIESRMQRNDCWQGEIQWKSFHWGCIEASNIKMMAGYHRWVIQQWYEIWYVMCSCSRITLTLLLTTFK